MTNIRELAPKPSDAIDAMIQGLKDHKKYGFEINMGTYMSTAIGTCYGCAATATLCKLTDTVIDHNKVSMLTGLPSKVGAVVSLDWERRITKVFGFNGNKAQIVDVNDFEAAINDMRNGYLAPLLEYYDVEQYDLDSLTERADEMLYSSRLNTDDWDMNLNAFEDLADMLREEGY